MEILISFVALFCLSSCEVFAGEEFWEKKDYTQWTAAECSRILNNSPWVKKCEIEILEYTIGIPKGNSTIKTAGYDRYTIVLRSALPVRQAIYRQNQIAVNYEKLSPEQKMAFDQRFEEPLSPTAFMDKIVISVAFGTNVSQRVSLLERAWRNYPHKKLILLGNNAGLKNQLIEFRQGATNNETLITFPRTQKEQQLLASGDDALVLELPLRDWREQVAYNLTLFKFTIRKLLYHGRLEY